jgi:penicillin amidase
VRLILRVVVGLLVLAALVGVALAAARFLVIPRAFPQVEGAHSLPGLTAPVDIYRDSMGIPHIYASSEHDLLMAQGFVHAQDRFWQMEFQRRIGSGRLSEVLGEAALPQDRYIRTVGWQRTAAIEAASLEPTERALLEAYAAGVNAYLETHPGSKGLEFTILGLTGVEIDPEPWTPLDTLTWGKVLAWRLGGEETVELIRAHIAARLGSSALPVLMPAYDPDYPLILGSMLSEPSLQAVPEAAYTPILPGDGLEIGSNNWVIGGDRTTTGTPLLANDPHLGIQMPSVWYEIGLHCEPVGTDCGINVVGASLPGTPGVVLGHNERIAWGLTNLGPDVVDFFVERQNPENPNQYEYQGEWLDMQLVREEIVVAGRGQPEIVNVRITRHGPIINDVVGGTVAEWAYGWEPLAFSWTGLEPGAIVKSVLLLNRAQNWDEFREALRFWDVPGQNAVYADVEGNIGYQATGRIPIRASGNGSMPVPGWTSQFEWVDTVPYEALPSAFNPPAGYISTANNAVVGPDYPYFLSMDWNPGYRARRIIELIEADESISLVDMQTIQRDSTPLYAQDILHHILAITPQEPRLQAAQDLLRSWDGRADRESAGAAMFEALRVELIKATFEDELGEQLLSRTRPYLIVTLANLLGQPERAAWFDDVRTTEVEDQQATILAALTAAVDYLSETLGDEMNAWRWGDLHTATFENQSLGQSGIAPIEWIFNRGPVETDGTIATVNNTGYDLGHPFVVDTTPSYRQIVDLGDFASSLSIHTTGQSGHPFHPHYDDMIEMWRNLQYHPMLWARAQVEAAAEAHLQLTP